MVYRTVFVTAVLKYASIITHSFAKVKCFLKYFFIFPYYIYTMRKSDISIDKTEYLWLNIRNSIYKDVDGKLAFFGRCREPAVGASRCERTKRSGSRVDLVKALVSNEIRLPPLRAGSYLRPRVISRKRDNQGGTANVHSSLRSCDLRDFLFKEWL